MTPSEPFAENGSVPFLINLNVLAAYIIVCILGEEFREVRFIRYVVDRTVGWALRVERAVRCVGIVVVRRSN